MSQASLLIPPKPQFFDNNGAPLAGGKACFYSPGTTTPKTVYSSSDGSTPLSNPVILDSAGRASIWLSGYYDMVLEDALGNQIYSESNVSSQYNVTTQFNQWLLQTDVLTYISDTEFTVPGDRTDDYQSGRRIKAIVAAGTIYGTIDTSAYTTLTTVDVIWDSGVLDSGLSAVYLGIITLINSSYPVATFEPPVGTVLAWHKAFTGVPATLPSSWHECDGSVISDVLSPMNGQPLPDLNGSGHFLRGSATSGTVQVSQNLGHSHGAGTLSAATHTHTTSGTAASHTHTLSTTTDNAATNHYHGMGINNQNSTVGGSGTTVGAPSGFGCTMVTDANNADHTHTLSGTSAASGALATSGTAAASGALAVSNSTAADSAATEARPVNMSVVWIMRIH